MTDFTASGAAPIVVVGTTRDPATPYRWAEELSQELDSGVLLSRDGDGHTAFQQGNACIDKAIEAYLARLAGLFAALRRWARVHGATYVRLVADERVEDAVRRVVERRVDA